MLELTACAGRFVSHPRRGQCWELQQGGMGLAGSAASTGSKGPLCSAVTCRGPLPLLPGSAQRPCPLLPPHQHLRSTAGTRCAAGGSLGAVTRASTRGPAPAVARENTHGTPLPNSCYTQSSGAAPLSYRGAKTLTQRLHFHPQHPSGERTQDLMLAVRRLWKGDLANRTGPKSPRHSH